MSAIKTDEQTTNERCMEYWQLLPWRCTARFHQIGPTAVSIKMRPWMTAVFPRRKPSSVLRRTACWLVQLYTLDLLSATNFRWKTYTFASAFGVENVSRVITCKIQTFNLLLFSRHLHNLYQDRNYVQSFQMWVTHHQKWQARLRRFRFREN